MAEGATNLNVPPQPDIPVAEASKGAFGRLTERWRAWFTALAEVTNWRVTGNLEVEGTSAAPVGGIFGSNPLLHVREEQPSGTNGGNFVNGAWRTRTLNTELANEIAGASLAANQITVPAGTYEICARAPGWRVDRHKAKLRNTSGGGVDVIIGGGSFSDNSGTEAQTDGWVMGQFTLTAEGVLELQHMAETTFANGFGLASGFGVVEVFADVMIWQLAEG